MREDGTGRDSTCQPLSKSESSLNNLVDPASSHMLVSKIKPCMSKQMPQWRSCEWLIRADNAATSMPSTRITVEILELIRASITVSVAYIGFANTFSDEAYIADCKDSSCNSSRGFLTYQLAMVGFWPTMALTGNGELGFDSGEGA